MCSLTACKFVQAKKIVERLRRTKAAAMQVGGKERAHCAAARGQETGELMVSERVACATPNEIRCHIFKELLSFTLVALIKQINFRAINQVGAEIWDIGYLGDISVFHVHAGVNAHSSLRATVANITRLVEQPLTWDDKVTLSWDLDAGVILTS